MFVRLELELDPWILSPLKHYFLGLKGPNARNFWVFRALRLIPLIDPKSRIRDDDASMSMNDTTYIRRFFSLYSQEEKDKVRGLAFYPTDYVRALLPADVAYVDVVRSPHAGATFDKVDATEALKIDGVLKVITAKDIPQNLSFAKRSKQGQLILADGKVRYRGEPCALVVAESREALSLAMNKIQVNWKAEEERAAEVIGKAAHQIGRPPSGQFVEIKLPFSFPSLHTRYLEAECGWVKYENGELVFHAGSLLSESQRTWLSQVLELPISHIKAEESPLGGYFGGRQQRELLAFLALSSNLTKRSTCLAFNSREQDVGSYGYKGELSLTYDPQSKRLKSLTGQVLIDAGSYEGNAQMVLQRTIEHAASIYDFEHVNLEGQVVCTPTHPRRAHRGEGLSAITWVTEQLVEQAAKAMEVNPLEFRSLNCNSAAENALQVVEEMEKLEKPFRLVPADRNRPVWDEKSIQGRGVAFQYAIPGAHKEFDLSEVTVELTNSGSFKIRTSNITLDLHIKQALAEVASVVLHTHPKAFTVEGKMREEIDKPARRETYPELYYLAQATWHASKQLAEQLKAAGNKIFGSSQVRLQDGALVDDASNRRMGYRELAFTDHDHDLKSAFVLKNIERPHGCSAGAVTRVGFHPLTGELRVESVRVVLDAGPVFYKKGLEIQLDTAISWSLAALFSSEFGSDQPIPTTLDGPDDVSLTTLPYKMEGLDERAPEFFGSRGVTDVLMSVVLASLVNAIYDAKNLPVQEIPMLLDFMYPKKRQQTVLNFPLKRF